MRRLAVIFMAVVPLLSFGQGPYKTFLEEGKKWTYSYTNPFTGNHYLYSHVVKGDTTILGQSYKKVKDESSGSYQYSLREDGKKVYCVYPSTESPVLLYDFGKEAGEVVSKESGADGKIVIKVLSVDAVNAGSRSLRRMEVAKYEYPLDGQGNEENAPCEKSVWIEGVGSNFGLTYPFSVPGNYSTFHSCHIGDEQLCDGEIFYAAGTPAGTEPYRSFMEEGKIWTLAVDMAINPKEYNTHKYVEMKLEGDTLIDGIHFKRRYEREWPRGEQKQEAWKATRIYIGEDGGKVYQFNSQTKEMRLDMDYTLKEGDTFQTSDFGGYTDHMPAFLVTAVTEEVLPFFPDRIPRKCIYLEAFNSHNYFTDVWVEGIGSLEFGIMGTNYYETVGGGYIMAKCCNGENVLYDGAVENEHEATVDGLRYCLFPETHEAAVAFGNKWTGELDIPSEISVDGEAYTVSGISHKAFRGCTGLTRVRIPKTIDHITRKENFDEDQIGMNMNPFAGCTSLEYIEVDSENTILRSEDGILYSKDGKSLYCYPAGIREEAYAVHDGVTRIGGNAFDRNGYLVSVELPQSVNRLCGGAFSHCASLETVRLPDGLKHIEGNMFQNCESLKSVEIPEGIESIGTFTFYGCTSLKQIDLPESVHTIGKGPFPHQNLDILVIRGILDSQSVNRHLFDGLSESAKVYVPASEIDRYKEVYSGTILPLEDYHTGIQVTTSAREDHNPAYDLNGRRIKGVPQKGVYIQNGRKVVVK